MSGSRDGGPAFPRDMLYPKLDGSVGKGFAGWDGMSLRDWFAGQALTYLGATSVAHQRQWSRDFREPWEESPLPELANDAYRIADAMLAAREASDER